jgi:hypothetical protein
MRRIVSDLNRQAQADRQVLQVFLETPMPIAIRTATLAQHEQLRGVPPMSLTLRPPPTLDGLASHLARIGATRQQHKAFVRRQIVDAVGHQATVAERGEIMVPPIDVAGRASPVEIPQRFPCSAILRRGVTHVASAQGAIFGRSGTICGYFLLFFFLGTLAPFLRASDKPIAMACLRLFTFFLDLPLFRVPFFFLCIARFTDFFAFDPYLAMITSSL